MKYQQGQGYKNLDRHAKNGSAGRITMRKIILSIPISLDGYIEGPHRELDWVTADDDLHDFYAHLLQNADLLLFGRVAYELLASYWPNAKSDPSITPGMARFADAINPMPKIVYSKTLEHVGWNTQVIRSADPEEIKKLKAKPGGDILLSGGAMIARIFIQNGLVDEYQLMVQPVAIGAGTALFGGIREVLKLNYIWNKPFNSGAIALCYRPDGSI